MKTKMLIGGTILMLAATSALAEENSSHDSGDLYRSNELSLDAFGSASLGPVLPDETKYYGVDRLGLRFAF